MTADVLKLIWDVLATLISCAAFTVAWFGRRDERNKLALEKLALEMEETEDRLQNRMAAKASDEQRLYGTLRDHIAEMHSRIGVLEENVKHLPTANDVRSLQTSITVLSAGIGKLEGAQNGMTRQVDLMNGYLMRTEKS
jgi:predicted  nucleic acid-binding Zn-ribbon protein